MQLRKARHQNAHGALDEVGLAEHSPDMPLKVLTVSWWTPINVVGISNWSLDAAK